MKIEKRDKNIKYPKSIKEEKVRLILDWLLEFRFSNIEILSKRIDSNKINSSRFINSLLSDGLIREFKNANTNNARFFILGVTGIGYLEAYGRDVSKAVTRTGNLGRYSQILHDISVQEAVIELTLTADNYDEVIWDKNINNDSLVEKPDALIHSLGGYWIALEFERWRKGKKRIYYSFYSHSKAISSQIYSGVIYVFSDPIDKVYYEELFSSSRWPIYKRLPKSGIMEDTNKTFKPSDVSNLSKCYKFISHIKTEKQK